MGLLLLLLKFSFSFFFKKKKRRRRKTPCHRENTLEEYKDPRKYIENSKATK